MNKAGIVLKNVLRLVLFLYSLIVVFPIVWAIYSSFKTNKEFFRSAWALPEKLNYYNYVNAWLNADIGNFFLNSVLVTMTMVVLTIMLGSTTAYILSRFKFKAKGMFIFLYISGMLVPTILGVVPTFLLLKQLKLLDSLIGLILVYTAYALPFSVFVLLGFFKSLPHELEEAAFIDGCTLNQTFWRIMMPLSKTGIITISIFNFISYWNEYIFALTFITTETKKTLSLGLISLMEVSRHQTDWGVLFAGLIIVMAPTILIYAIFQSRITQGLTLGALKG